ncbi:MAG TPA: hypothetical protein VJ044_03705 [Candidatus Hodarchaeales archaeon]|nr:hypothetical protein [Candidatus Hodarchaeales archaeon]
MLDLRGSKLAVLPETIGNFINLHELFLDDNKLVHLPDSIENLTSLRQFHLFDNKLTKLQESLGKLTNLRHLTLSLQDLALIPDSLAKLPTLETFGFGLIDSLDEIELYPKTRGERFMDKVSISIGSFPTDESSLTPRKMYEHFCSRS